MAKNEANLVQKLITFISHNQGTSTPAVKIKFAPGLHSPIVTETPDGIFQVKSPKLHFLQCYQLTTVEISPHRPILLPNTSILFFYF